MYRKTLATVLTALSAAVAVPMLATANGPTPGCPEPPQPCQAFSTPTRHPVPAVPDGTPRAIVTTTPIAVATPRSTIHPINVPNAGGGPG